MLSSDNKPPSQQASKQTITMTKHANNQPMTTTQQSKHNKNKTNKNPTYNTLTNPFISPTPSKNHPTVCPEISGANLMISIKRVCEDYAAEFGPQTLGFSTAWGWAFFPGFCRLAFFWAATRKMMLV